MGVNVIYRLAECTQPAQARLLVGFVSIFVGPGRQHLVQGLLHRHHRILIQAFFPALGPQIETLGESEVPAKAIGEMVMEGLRGLDTVAYIRFASVYRDFTEARDFEEFASSVSDAAKE